MKEKERNEEMMEGTKNKTRHGRQVAWLLFYGGTLLSVH